MIGRLSLDVVWHLVDQMFFHLVVNVFHSMQRKLPQNIKKYKWLPQTPG